MPYPPKYVIDYRQVNIGVGDCEIILLVKDVHNTTPIIMKAVLVDGGKGGEIPVSNIRRVFDQIKESYKITSFQLDAIVITHWDTDHYTGVFALIDDELTKMQGQSTALSFLNYDSKEPTTILYAPYEFSPTSSQMTYGDDTATKKRYLIWRKTTKACVAITDSRAMPDVLKSSSGRTRVPDPFVPGCTSILLGAEIFQGQLLTVDKMLTANSPLELLAAHASTDGLPGLYCVAVNNKFLTPTGTLPKLLRSVTTCTNRSSIICMVIRSDGSMTHYLGGDAPRDLETRVVQWSGLPDGGTGIPEITETVPVIKASHHGAWNSFPFNILGVFKPSYVMISAGSEHRHPSESICVL